MIVSLGVVTFLGKSTHLPRICCVIPEIWCLANNMIFQCYRVILRAAANTCRIGELKNTLPT